MKRHLIILLILTALVQGILMVSYPMGGFDDDQSAHRYQIDQLVQGNLLIGNLRYHTGYPLVIAPVVAVSHLFGSLDERVWLLAQVLLSSLIPFLVYDIIRLRRSPNEAFIVALVVLLDPFGLQWAHFALPNWLIALCFVLALWLIQRGLIQPRRMLIWIAGSGVVLGVAALARLNLAPVIAILGVLFLLLRSFSFRTRLKMLVTLGVCSAAVLAGYVLLIHYPSTGTFNLSCYTGTNLLVSVYIKQFSITADNGAETRRLLDLLTLEPLKTLSFTQEVYPRWSEPGSWVTPQEREAFLSQSAGTPPQQLPYAWPGTLFYYLGPCETDDMLLAVHNEAVAAQPFRWLASIPIDVFNMLVQRPLEGNFHPQYLPRPAHLEYTDGTGPGFWRSEGEFYNGHWVWRPGIELFSAVFDLWNAIKWLTPLAVIWALWSRDWFYGTAAVLLVASLVLLSIFGNPAPRLYAPLYPLWPLLIGGLLAAILTRLRPSEVP